jgi:prepilin-type processing-associated H-X9-DG protein
VAGVAAAGGMSVVAIILIVVAVVLAGVCVIGILIAMLLPAVSAARQAGQRAQCANNLRQITIAMQNYEAANGTLPPAYVADEDGKPMHSWRVLLLPYLDEDALYRQYNFDEPWDSPANLMVASRMPQVYGCPSDPQAAAGQTSYMVLVGPETMFPDANPTGLADCGDGTSNTILVVEVAGAGVGWTEPADLNVEQLLFEIGVPGEIGGLHPGGANVSFADSHIQFIQDSTPAEVIKALSTRNGGEDVYLP